MSSLITLAESLGLAYMSGISLYATVALLGFASHEGWVGPLPGVLSGLVNPFEMVTATILAVIEFIATLVPGVASLWETAHTFIRPPAAAVLAVESLVFIFEGEQGLQRVAAKRVSQHVYPMAQHEPTDNGGEPRAGD